MLTMEWRRRITKWKDYLPELFFTPLGEVEFSGFVSTELMPVEKAKEQSFTPMPKGTKWGAKWEYGWFRAEVTFPDSVKGKRIVVKPDVGAEAAVYINGLNAGAVDAWHKEITVSQKARGGEKVEVMVEGYAGHGPRVEHAPFNAPGTLSVPEPPPTQAEVGSLRYGVWNEEIFQLWLDVQTLFEIRENRPEGDLWQSTIDSALKEFTNTVDFEKDFDEMLKTVAECRKKLRPLLECVNGTTAPTYYAFGHSHIDVAWLWPLQETIRKCSRTFATQLGLIDEYPEYKFLQSQAQLYAYTKEHFPALYERIKKAVKAGNFIADGALWVESDTNVPSGESLIRQFMHGKRFFKEEFGVDSRLCWLPDVFGYTAALPQIMKGCEVDYFATTKILSLYNGGEVFPFGIFWWEGIDGSRVLTHVYGDYSARTSPHFLIDRWNSRQQKDNMSSRVYAFGWGDGGGGATREHLEFAARAKDIQGVPKVRLSAPTEYFEDVLKTGGPKDKYVGELYYQAHRGTYTSQAKTKKGNRKGEFALREAEMWGTIASRLNGGGFNSMTLDGEWKQLLLNQFHDILPGSGIERVYKEAEEGYAAVLAGTKKETESAARLIAGEGEGLTVFNSLSWEDKKLIELPEGITGAADERGDALPVQDAMGKVFTEVTVPSCGWTTVYSSEVKADNDTKVLATENSLENELIKVVFNDNGEITSIFDKEEQREIAAGPCNEFRMYKDTPSLYDAWDIDSMYKDNPVPLRRGAKMEVIAQGPLFAAIKITKKLAGSALEQVVTLRKGSRRVDFKTKVDWQERHKLLKVCFPVDIHSNEAIHEIQFGHIRRPNHYSRRMDAQMFESCNHKWTALAEENYVFAVLNDCKYGVNVYENSINLTLLKSATAPDMNADKGIQEFTYAFYAANSCFAGCDLIREGYRLNTETLAVKGIGGSASMFSVDRDNVFIDTVKPAEDGSGDVVIRLYEGKRMKVPCTLSMGFDVISAQETNMLERNGQKLDVVDNKIRLTFRPFEVKTVRLKVKA